MTREGRTSPSVISTYIKFLLVFTNLPSPVFSPQLCILHFHMPSFRPSFFCPHLFSPLPPSLFPPLSFHSSTSFLCPSPSVSPVYEGKFIGLPGAVSWRWPPLLKPQQGFTLHMEQKEHSGHTGLFPSPHIIHDGALHTSHYLLMSIPVFFPLPLLDAASLHHVLDEWLGGFSFLFFSRTLYCSI